MKHPLTLVIFGWWLTMLALLVRKQVSPPTTDLATLAASDATPMAREEWFGVYQGERKIGWAQASVGRNPRVVGYETSFGPSASYYAWEAAGRPVHGIRGK